MGSKHIGRGYGVISIGATSDFGFPGHVNSLPFNQGIHNVFSSALISWLLEYDVDYCIEAAWQSCNEVVDKVLPRDGLRGIGKLPLEASKFADVTE